MDTTVRPSPDFGLRYDIPPWIVAGTIPKIFPALAAVMKGIDAVGKDRRNEDQKYRFRGIDDVFNALHGVLAEFGVITPPRVLQRVLLGERTTKSGGTMQHIALEVEFRMIADDGSALIVGPVWAEALDTSDKATNKCMSFAMKYVLLQTFTIPTEDVSEGDKNTPELGQRVERDAGAPPPPKTEPIGRDTAAKIYSALQELGVTKEQLHRKLQCLDVADVANSMVPTIKLWRDEIAKNPKRRVELFGGTSPTARAENQ